MEQASIATVQPDAVTVYASDTEVLIAEIARALCAALAEGNAVVCIATGTHRRLLEKQLRHYGIDVVAALNREQLVSLNALETLSKIIIGGVPDVGRFADVIATLVDRTAARYRRVVIFTELVALMRADGQHGPAIELERLWGSFTAVRPEVCLQREYPALELLSRTSVAFTHRTLGRQFRGTGRA